MEFFKIKVHKSIQLLIGGFEAKKCFSKKKTKEENERVVAHCAGAIEIEIEIELSIGNKCSLQNGFKCFRACGAR